MFTSKVNSSLLTISAALRCNTLTKMLTLQLKWILAFIKISVLKKIRIKVVRDVKVGEREVDLVKKRKERARVRKGFFKQRN